MKKIFLWASLCLFAVSCSNETIESDNGVTNAEKVLAPVTVRVNGFSVTQEEMASGGGTTRAAQDVADYNGVKVLTLAFYDGSTEVCKTTQKRWETSGYTTFGVFSCNLPIGIYTMVVIGYDYLDEGDEIALTSSTMAGYTSERPRETFCASQSVTVTAAGADASVTMNRIITRLNIISTDQISSGVAKIRTTYGGGSKSFDPTSGLATDDNGFSLTNNPAVKDGHLGICNFAFLATDEETMTITIEALDADNHVLFTKSVPGVPLKRNRQTTLTGAIFTASASSAAFQVETAWIEGNTVNF